MNEGCFACIYKIEDVEDSKFYAMKIEKDTENVAREIRVLKKIEKSKSDDDYKKDCISKVIEYGFLGLENFSDQNKDEIQSFGFYVMPLYDCNLQ